MSVDDRNQAILALARMAAGNRADGPRASGATPANDALGIELIMLRPERRDLFVVLSNGAHLTYPIADGERMYWLKRACALFEDPPRHAVARKPSEEADAP